MKQTINQKINAIFEGEDSLTQATLFKRIKKLCYNEYRRGWQNAKRKFNHKFYGGQVGEK